MTSLLFAGCAAEAPPIRPQSKESTQPAEAGLWMVSRMSERAFASSGLRIDSPELSRYLDRVTCRVAGRYCADIRTYGAAISGFNASMAPNGFMQVWTGLLLRVENEAQLAAVLGHEISHYILRHSLERFETRQRTAGVLLAAQLGTSLGGLGGVSFGPVMVDPSDVGRLVATGYLAAYSREQESEADHKGFRLMVDAGYAVDQAAAVWANLIAERKACDLPTPPALFATHPPSKQRLRELRELARGKEATPGKTERARFLKITLPLRNRWLRMELADRHLCRVRVVIERLLEGKEGHGVLHYYQGEMYRLRNGEGDLGRAIEAYRKALEHPDAPVRTWRELGLALWQAGRPDEAKVAFRRYLRTVENPRDEAMIQAYLAELRP